LPLREIRTNPTVYDFGDVDLLTLSACSTAYGPSGHGQDLESFAAIVLGKGARAVLATQWPVADRSTASFMSRFYRLQVEDNMSRAKALALTQREFIKGGSRAWSDPFVWAPFVLIGNEE
jgi:CHAT domain-containing protein